MIVSVYKPSIEAAHEFLLEASIADEEFMQFFEQKHNAFGGLWVVMRLRASRCAELLDNKLVHLVDLRNGYNTR